MKTMNVGAQRVARVFVALLAIGAFPDRAFAESREPEALVDGFVRTWNAHDINGLAQLFTEDADFVNVAGDRLDVTRLRAELEYVHGTFFKASTITSTGATTRFIDPGIAIVHFTWQMDGQVDTKGDPVARRRGIITFVAVKREAGWKITALQNTNMREQPPQ